MEERQTASPEEEKQKNVEEQVIKILNEQIRPAIQQDGGDIVFMGMDGLKVQVQLQGACVGCPNSQYTLKMGVEQYLKKLIPEVEEVVAV